MAVLVREGELSGLSETNTCAVDQEMDFIIQLMHLLYRE